MHEAINSSGFGVVKLTPKISLEASRFFGSFWIDAKMNK